MKRLFNSASSGCVTRHGVARMLSKLGVCSRSQAEQMVRLGRVTVAGRLVRDPEFPVIQGQRLTLDGVAVDAMQRVYLALNKPRGLVSTAADEYGRATVYDLLMDAKLPWLGPVGRLDKASEGLLLFSNDSAWAARLTDPASHLSKTYHVQIDARPEAAVLESLRQGVVDRGERLSARSVGLLREGEKNAWLEIVLEEGRNRHIRRLLAVYGIGVQRLIRVAIGALRLGALGKGQWRHLSEDELRALQFDRC